MLAQVRVVVDEVARVGVARGVLSVEGLKAVRTMDLLGRYVLLTRARAGAFMGLHLPLWREHGATPLWLRFHGTEWGRGAENGPQVQAWAGATNTPFVGDGPRGFSLGLRIRSGADLDQVVESVLAQLGEVEAVMLG